MNAARAIGNGDIGKGSRFFVLLAVGFGVNGVAAAAAGPAGQAKAFPIPDSAVAYDLREISAFDVPDVVRNRFLTGAITESRTEPDVNFKRYPALQSDKPLSGSFHVGGAPAEPKTGYHYAFAVDESAGTGRGYDRIYIDTNLNGDLMDDPGRAPLKDVPAKALFTISAIRAQVCFETVAIRVTPPALEGRSGTWSLSGLRAGYMFYGKRC